MEAYHTRGIGREHPKSHLIQLLAAIIFFLIWTLDTFIFIFSTILALYIPFIVQVILFLSFLIVGLSLIFITGHILFHREDKEFRLIKTGIFAYIRHPLYLGVFLIYLGFIVFSMSLISIIGFIIVYFLYDWIAKFEENELETIFKDEYLEYKKKVNKWIPSLKRR